MKKSPRLWTIASLVFIASGAVAQTPPAKVTPGQGAQPRASAAHATERRFGTEDEAKLEAMVAQHRRVRSRLPGDYQTTLDKLTAEARRQLFAAPLPVDLLASAANIVGRMIPGLAAPEAAILAEYVLGGIAAGGVAAGDPTREKDAMQEMQMSFNMQYLQLQTQMQDENRRYTLVSNVMKNKHDVARNSINNIR